MDLEYIIINSLIERLLVIQRELSLIELSGYDGDILQAIRDINIDTGWTHIKLSEFLQLNINDDIIKSIMRTKEAKLGEALEAYDQYKKWLPDYVTLLLRLNE